MFSKKISQLNSCPYHRPDSESKSEQSLQKCLQQWWPKARLAAWLILKPQHVRGQHDGHRERTIWKLLCYHSYDIRISPPDWIELFFFYFPFQRISSRTNKVTFPVYINEKKKTLSLYTLACPYHLELSCPHLMTKGEHSVPFIHISIWSFLGIRWVHGTRTDQASASPDELVLVGCSIDNRRRTFRSWNKRNKELKEINVLANSWTIMHCNDSLSIKKSTEWKRGNSKGLQATKAEGIKVESQSKTVRSASDLS